MRKAVSILICIFMALTALLPSAAILSVRLGYTFQLISIPAFAIALAVLSVCIIILDAVFQYKIKSIVFCILLSIAAPLSLINTAFYICAYHKAIVITSVFISIGCSCYLTAKHVRPLALKIVAFSMSALMILPLCFISLPVLLLGNFSQNTVVQTIESPSGKYYAQVIDSNQGALGGSTFVEIHRTNNIDFFFFQLSKEPQRVYTGDWLEYQTMHIYWKNDSCLVINSLEYRIE